MFAAEPDPQTVISQYWADTPLFKDIPLSQISKLVKTMHFRQFQKDEVIFHKGDLGAGAILVASGSVNISSNDVCLATLNTGEFFGEIALAENDFRTADATAIENTELVFFFKQDAEEWMVHEPKYAARFLKNLASVLALRLQNLNTQFSK